MGYDIKARFYVDGKYKFSMFFNELKNLNETRYAANLDIKSVSCDIKTPEVEDRYADWYDINSFANKVKELEEEIAKKYTSLLTKENIKNTLEYYRLSDEQKQTLEDDISELKEDIEYDIYAKSAAEKMIGFISVLEDGNISEDDEDDSGDYTFKRSDVKVFRRQWTKRRNVSWKYISYLQKRWLKRLGGSINRQWI